MRPSSTGAITFAAPSYNGAIGFTVFDWLLPYVEQETLYQAANGNVNTVVNGTPVMSAVVPAYLCPMDPSPSGSTHLGVNTSTNSQTRAIGNYAANYFVFGNPGWVGPFPADMNRREQGSGTIQSIFRDGTSNVIVFTERYGTCGSTGNPNNITTGTNLWSSSDTICRPVFCLNIVQMPVGSGYSPPCALFEVRPDWINGCDFSRAESGHSGGINVCLGDGSVRFLTAGISATTWAQACDPQDGIPLGPDWN